jgi:hypothetical protein
VTLPSDACGAVTHEVGYFERGPSHVAVWLKEGLGGPWAVKPARWGSLGEAATSLAPSAALSRYAAIPIGSWTLLMTNGPLGTDVGLLPSQAARELGCRAIRAVCVGDDEPGYPARILEVYGPDGAPPLASVRSIAAANDGGRGVFETTGDALAFERIDQYAQPRKSDRFTSELLYEYLRALEVPIDTEPEWGGALIVESADARA